MSVEEKVGNVVYLQKDKKKKRGEEDAKEGLGGGIERGGGSSIRILASMDE